jgi:hypothetical protein
MRSQTCQMIVDTDLIISLIVTYSPSYALILNPICCFISLIKFVQMSNAAFNVP